MTQYLTAGENGEPFRTGDRGTPSMDQKWRLILSKDDSGLEFGLIYFQNNLRNLWILQTGLKFTF